MMLMQRVRHGDPVHHIRVSAFEGDSNEKHLLHTWGDGPAGPFDLAHDTRRSRGGVEQLVLQHTSMGIVFHRPDVVLFRDDHGPGVFVQAVAQHPALLERRVDQLAHALELGVVDGI